MKMIQIRNVRDDLHRKLKARAALEGMSLSDYLKLEMERIAERPSRAEFRRRLAARRKVKTSASAAEVIREERESR